MTTNHELQNTLSKKCGFLVTVEDGIAWPNTSETPARLRAERLKALAGVVGTSVAHGMYVRLPA